MDNDSESGISEETLRLVRELGARLEKDTAGLQFRAVTEDLSYAPPRDAELRLARPAMELRQDWYGPGALPEYLQELQSDIMMGRLGAYWLHGEDARERGRAGDILAVLLAEGGRRSWATAVIDLSKRPPRRRDRAGSELELAVRRVWDAWDEDPGVRPATGILRGPAFRPGSRGRSGVAIFLPEFPARDKKTAPFLEWLASGVAVGSVPQLVIVSTESPPEAPVGAGFQPVLCESAAARMGRRIAELRLRKGWNRAELAARSEVPQSTLAQVEGGLRLAGGALLKRVAQALGTEPDDLRRA